jgi:eukaryotic-like serine/threonine-protein kinase
LEAGDLISGKYRLLRLLGSGGMGSVWAARNELTDRDFAVKFLHPRLAENKEALHRFFLEARACGQIKHPAVVEVYDMGQAEDGSPYLVMQLLEGEGFDQRLTRAGVFRPSEAATWIAFVARGLEEAHVRGLVHRDLKPGNVFFALDDRGDVIPKLLDFGVSKATSNQFDIRVTDTGAVLGSPAYMSPEQARGDADIDGRSDVWSLGVILYESLTGKMPFDAGNYNALMVAIITQPHKPVAEIAPGVPGELSQIVDRALAKDRDQRIGTARELAERLEFIATRITESAAVLYGTRTPTMMGATPNNNRAPTTQSAWTDGPATIAKRRKSTAALAASLGGAAVFVTALVAYFQTRPPLVNVAGRSGVALTASLSRLKADFDREAAASQAEAKAKETKPPEAPAPSAPAPSAASSHTASASAAPPSQPRNVPKGPTRSASKGSSIPVNGPGF